MRQQDHGGHARLGRAIHAARGRRGARPRGRGGATSPSPSGALHEPDAHRLQRLPVELVHEDAVEAAATGRLADWTVCSSAWRTRTRSTWSETSGAPDSAAPSTAPRPNEVHSQPLHSRLCQWCGGSPACSCPRRCSRTTQSKLRFSPRSPIGYNSVAEHDGSSTCRVAVSPRSPIRLQ